MASNELKLEVSLELMAIDAIKNFATDYYNKYGASIHNINIEWIDFDVIGDSGNAIVKDVKIDMKKKFI